MRRPFPIVVSLFSTAAIAATDGALKEYQYQDGSYFYSALPAEQQTVEQGLIGPGWGVTGNSFTVWLGAQPSGSYPVCRFRGDAITVPGFGHFYSGLPSECEAVKSGTAPFWLYEGVGFYAYQPSASGCPSGTTAIYRQYNPGLHNHHFQSRNQLSSQMQAAGWALEGIAFCVGGVTESTSPTAGGIAWTQDLLLMDVAATTVGGIPYNSSSRLRLTWSPPGSMAPEYYVTTVSDAITGEQTDLTSTAASLEISGLKSASTYSVVVRACVGGGQSAQCYASSSAQTLTATTATETWQILGTGHGYANATRVVSDGSVLSWAMQFGNGAPAGLLGKTRYYYKAISASNAGIGIAITSGAGTDTGNLTAFVKETSGLWQTCATMDKPAQCKSGDLTIAAVQAVPLARGKVRLYFEAADAADTTATTRIYSLDSQDSLTGLDFNRGSGTSCGGIGSSDYAAGGDCAPTLEIDAGTGTAAANSGLAQARQFKIGYPVLDDWRWDGAADTFMAITGADACGKVSNGLFLAHFDGSSWSVTKDAAGCAQPLVEAGHGPVVVHMGGARYKLYYEDESGGRTGKPLRVTYANGALSGNATKVDVADWEAVAQARHVDFLWPDGTALSADEESGLGDHMILLPDGDLQTQYMYLNLGGFDNPAWGKASAGLGMAVLINP